MQKSKFSAIVEELARNIDWLRKFSQMNMFNRLIHQLWDRYSLPWIGYPFYLPKLGIGLPKTEFFFFHCINLLILCLHDLPSLSPKVRYFARSGPPFVIRSVLIGWGCPGLQMVDLSERENGLWGERGEIVQTELPSKWDVLRFLLCSFLFRQ